MQLLNFLLFYLYDDMSFSCRYMAPELLIDDYRYPTADVFSLGLTLYEVCVFLDNREAVCSGQSALPSGGDEWHLLRRGQVILSQYTYLPS